ncbi:calphotin-like [Cydia pomonella]|uniref:calphotin-like n=1 Tax=Cydia pomonella TaxID=82600 RepID=UPI002ADD6AA1|nr:calphotin-like [Cydia pomonella]
MKFFAVFAAVLALAAAAPTTQWTLNELSEAIQNPATPAEFLPYLEHALNNMMEMLFAGQPVDSIVVPTPVGLLPVEIANPAVVMPVEVVDTPIAPVAPGVVAEPIVPAAVNDASGNPLVQIIVNINQESPAAVEVPSPVVVPEAPVEIQPTPVIVVDEAPVEIQPTPVIVVDEAPAEIAPTPVEIVPAPIEVVPAPTPIEIAPAPENPIDVIAVETPIPAPEPIVIAPENPIDVIAVGAPEVNPADLLAPVPVVVAGDAEGDRVLSTGIEDANTKAPCKKVLEGVLNDFMDLAYGKETPYTTGKTVLPTGSTIEDVDKAIADGTTKKPYKDVFIRISEKVKSKQNTMKLLLLTLFVAVGFANPIPTDPYGDAVEVVVNGLAEGEALDIGHIVDVKVKEIVDGEVAAVANALHPFTAQGLAEAAAAAEAEQAAAVPEITEPVAPEVPEVIVLPEPGSPEVVPEPVVIPEPAVPEVIPAPIVLPEPATPEVAPEPIVLPEPAAPEVIPDPIVLPEPAAPEVAPEIAPEPVAVVELPEVADTPQVNGEIFNNGVVSITVNTPEDTGVIATLSSWVSMMVNYVHSGITYTQQLI